MGGKLVVGGGAAGYFAAITSARAGAAPVLLVEAGAKPLRKVAISGGGRCNVTHSCFDPNELIKAYPRGARELRGAFSRFQPRDTVAWFEECGVRLKTEADGRIFPVTDLSQTIIDCLENERQSAKVSLAVRTKVAALKSSDRGFIATLDSSDGSRQEEFESVVIASGSSPGGYALAESLGHSIVPCVPSLFTFKVEDARLRDLAGISVESSMLRLEWDDAGEVTAQGPLLITHWGFSGPAVIRLSAWAARRLAACNYRARLVVSWVGDLAPPAALEQLRCERDRNGKKQAASTPLFGLPRRLWGAFCSAADIPEGAKFGELRAEQLSRLVDELTAGSYSIVGKGEFKEEFVTCGGVNLAEVDFRRMESKVAPGLYFAGEVLDIDGITGGYNFQSAWTTGWIAGSALAAAAN